VSQREAILSEIRLVPSLPTVVLKVRRLLRDPDVSFSELSRAIELEPDLPANILRLANSAYFGFQRTVGSVREAIVRLGTQRVYHLIIGFAVAPLARRPVEGYALPADALWEHSVATAIGAECLATALEISCPDHVFTAGLLHDIGKTVLGPFVKEHGEQIGQIAQEEGVPFDAAEQRALGIDHAEVGALLLERWNLPTEIVTVARWHHDPNQVAEDRTVTDLVHTADALNLAAGIGAGIDGLHYRACAESADNLKLTRKVNEAVVCRTMEGVAELTSLFGSAAER